MPKPSDNHARRIATNRLRNVLALLYFALGVWAAFRAAQLWGSTEGMALLLIALWIVAILAGVVLAYLFSLFTVGLLYRTRLPMAVVAILAFISGPGLLALLIYVAL